MDETYLKTTSSGLPVVSKGVVDFQRKEMLTRGQEYLTHKLEAMVRENPELADLFRGLDTSNPLHRGQFLGLLTMYSVLETQAFDNIAHKGRE